MQPLIDDLAKIKELEHLDKESLRFLYESIIKYKQYVREQTIDEFTERLKKSSIRGSFEYTPDHTKPWLKEKSHCKVIGTRKIDEVATTYKEELSAAYEKLLNLQKEDSLKEDTHYPLTM